MLMRVSRCGLDEQKKKWNVRGMSVNGSDFHTASRFLLSNGGFKGGRAPKRCNDATFSDSQDSASGEEGKNDNIK